MYTQCTLVKDNIQQTVWIPSELAKVGKCLKIKKNNVWDEGWCVQTCGMTLSDEYVRAHERDYMTQRKASDI